jgi:hypothetical protein
MKKLLAAGLMTAAALFVIPMGTATTANAVPSCPVNYVYNPYDGLCHYHPAPSSYPDPAGAVANTGSLPHSDNAEIDLPPGSRLLPSNPVSARTHSEHWSYAVSQSDMVAWLRQRLPVGQPFHGIAWCGAPQIDGQTAWEWISNGERFYVQVTDYNLVEFQRGSAAFPCLR